LLKDLSNYPYVLSMQVKVNKNDVYTADDYMCQKVKHCNGDGIYVKNQGKLFAKRQITLTGFIYI